MKMGELLEKVKKKCEEDFAVVLPDLETIVTYTLEVVREFAEKNNHTISAMVSFDRSATEKVVSLTKLLRFISGELER